MSSNSYVNLKIATCLVRYADDRLIDQRFLRWLKRKRAVKWRKKHRAGGVPGRARKRGGFLERRGESVGVQRDDCMKNRTLERKEM
ncbi:hypothetical protein [Burkholderia cenocepacia]|uniref:hypothetical protein n=1 Tax=Burkholderia cenocepacia TaxID=95486 RepID=UPI0015C5753F|nr:hypothetical protein [Burkholderia cenocepacia]